MRLGRGQHAERDVVAGHERCGGRLGRGEQVRQRAHPELLGELPGKADLTVDASMPALAQRVAVAAVPLLHRAELGRPGHERDLAVPERRQVAGGLVPARVVVHDHGVHRRQPGDRLVHHDHREPAGDCAARAARSTGTSRGTACRRWRRTPAARCSWTARTAWLRCEQSRTMLPVPFHRLDHVVGDRAEVRVADLGDDEADHAGPAPGQVPGLRVRHVAELADGLEHLGLGGRRHPELAVEVPRHGRGGHPGRPGHVLDRGHLRSIGPSRLTACANCT